MLLGLDTDAPGIKEIVQFSSVYGSMWEVEPCLKLYTIFLLIYTREYYNLVSTVFLRYTKHII